LLEWFRFSDAFKRIVFDLLEECVDALEDFFVGFLPEQIILPGIF
jgi:hypothetical protein